MPAAQFGLSSHSRGRGGLPDLPVINLFADEAPTEDTGICLQSRPGMTDRSANMGAEAIRGLFKGDGVLSGQLFGIAGGELYEGTTSLGWVGTGAVSWGGYEDKLFVNAGSAVHCYDGASFAPLIVPDGQAVAAIAVGSSRLLVVTQASETLYWSDPLTGTIDGLSFASAESSPDRLRDVLYLDDTAILFGAETVEFWPSTQDADLPFAPLEARVIERGIRNTGACCPIGPSFAWVTNECQVAVQTEDNVISNTGMQRRIENSTECSLFRFTLEGNEFIALRLDDETQVYSRRSGMWSEFRTYGMDNWHATAWAGGVFGGSDGKTLAWGTDHVDAVAGELERRFRAGVPLNSGGVPISNVSLRCDVGSTPYLTGDYIDPRLEMRQSRDNGRTWEDWEATTLGEQADYSAAVEWFNCGMASRPGWLAEFRIMDPVPFRVSGVFVNEPYGGR